MEPVTVENTNDLNLTAYAIGDAAGLCVTVINKEYGPGARDANVIIATKGSAAASAATLFMMAPDGNVSATDGVTLGRGQRLQMTRRGKGNGRHCSPAIRANVR